MLVEWSGVEPNLFLRSIRLPIPSVHDPLTAVSRNGGLGRLLPLKRYLADVPLVGAPFDSVSSFGAVLGLWVEFLIIQEQHESFEGDLDMLAHNIHRLAVEVPIVEKFIVSFEPSVEVFNVRCTDDHEVTLLFAKKSE